MRMLEKLVNDDLVKMLAKTVSRGYVLTQQIRTAHEIFSIMEGKEVLPYIRRVAIDFTAKRNAPIVKGLVAEEKPNKTGNYHHIELIFNDQLVITISHLASINGVEQDIPRPAIFREMLSINNPLQEVLFPNYPERYFGEGRVLATLIHRGKDFPTDVGLILLNRSCDKVIDSVPIKVAHLVNDSDVNKIEPLTPEFIELIKKASGQ